MVNGILQHPEYVKRAPQWRKIRDALAGEDQIKQAGQTYLPMLGSQKEDGDREQYADYLCRASWYGASKRTQQGLVGACTRKGVAMDGVPDEHVATLQDQAGQSYEGLGQISADLLRELVSIGRVGLLVDADQDDGELPYIATIAAEQIVWWRREALDGRLTLTMAVLAEDYELEKPNDPFGDQAEKRPQWRCLRLGVPDDQTIEMAPAGAFEGAGIDPVYWQEIWRQPDGADGKPQQGQSLVRVSVMVPRKTGGRLWREIPFDIVNATGGITTATEEPQMLDLVNVQLAHYRGSADLEWGRHMCAIPQPWVAGFEMVDEANQPVKYVVGARGAWAAREVDAKVGYLEFTGAGLGHLAEGQKEKETHMAVLGARMLEERANGVEAMGTVALRQAGERSVLSTIAGHASEALTRAVQRWLSWTSPAFETDAAQKTVSVTVQADVDTKGVDAATLTALTLALQQGSISWDTFAYQLARGEMLPEGVTAEEEAKRIQAGAPGRSRTAELTILQQDVLAGRITTRTYLERAQELGFYAGLDIDAEIEAVEAEKSAASESLMIAAMARGAFGAGGDPPAGGGGADPGQGGADPAADEPDDQDDDEQPEGGGST